ncbi:MAG: acyltransferase [Candidatus Acidiferrales bacterium]|jgi:peptidoglycan/LPS O-acetylase OafA/YrhL
MDQSYEKFRGVRFFGSLDGLRALSIVAVMWLHAWWETPYYPRLEAMPVLRQGFYGVQVFFVVSGFLITTLLLREMERYGTISLRDFYIRRALRIWPLYYAVVAIYVVNALVLERGTVRAASFLHYLPSFATFTYTWFISANWPGGMFNLAWTLSTEEQFYFFWPVVLRFLRGVWSSVLLIGIIALKLATDYHLTERVLPPGWLPTRIVQSVAIAICLGVLLAQALHRERGFRLLYRVLGRKWSAPVMMIAVLVCLAPARPPWLVAFISTTALVGACVVREDNGLAWLLRLKPVAFVGTVSYGMYLLNSLCVHGVRAVLHPIGLAYPPMIFVITLGVTVAAAYLSYRFYESRFLALKERFSRLRKVPAHQTRVEIGAHDVSAPMHP